MTTNPPRGSYVFHVRSYELGPKGRASLAAVCHLLQESASLHAHQLEASPAQLLERGMTWFLARLRLRVHHYPRWRDEVTVETWPAEVAPPFAIRDFRVLDERGEEIAAATSSWLLMDMARRRPLRRIPPEILALHPTEPVRALPVEASRLPRLDDAEREEHVRVGRSDLDLNEHVNHVFYVARVEESVPVELWKSARVSELEIEFKSECHLGDELAARSAAEGNDRDIWLHSLVRTKDGGEAVRARTRWVSQEL